MGLGLVLLPTLALAVLVRGVMEADRQARARELAAGQQRLQARTSDLARTLALHDGLFPEPPADRFALGVTHPELAPGIEVDARCEEWRLARDPSARPCRDSLIAYDRAELLAHDNDAYDPRDFSFALLAAREDAYLHVFVRVVDDQLAPRGPQLDEGDHLRLITAIAGNGGSAVPRRFVVTPGPDGSVTTYQVDRTWREVVPPQRRVSWGRYQLEIYRRPYGAWRRTADGYDIELRLPLRTLGPDWRKVEIGLAAVDVDLRPELERGLSRQVMWVAPQREGRFALEAPDAARFSPALEDLELDLGARRLAFFDARGRELFASLGDRGPGEDALRERVRALLTATRLDVASDTPAVDPTLAAARVEARGGELRGIVIETDPTPPVRPALASVLAELPTTAAALAGALLLLFLLLGYTRRLSRRILALVEDVGVDRDADDEIGELSRWLAELVERDRAHRGYLEQLPRILGHETLGPLGVVKMAVDELPASDGRRDSARRAIHSIEDLIEDLREATSLEEALEKGERIQVDLVDFVREYAGAYQEANDTALELRLPDGSFRTRVVERRIEQLLDKLLDNAADFSDGSAIELALEIAGDEARLRVTNVGSQLPANTPPDQLFAPMSSWRKRTTERHLGLGLYVARLIAQQHGGDIRAWNVPEDRVVFEVTLPRGA